MFSFDPPSRKTSLCTEFFLRLLSSPCGINYVIKTQGVSFNESGGGGGGGKTKSHDEVCYDCAIVDTVPHIEITYFGRHNLAGVTGFHHFLLCTWQSTIHNQMGRFRSHRYNKSTSKKEFLQNFGWPMYNLTRLTEAEIIIWSRQVSIDFSNFFELTVHPHHHIIIYCNV